MHGAGAQRTDPKIENPTLSRGDFFGPQLDLISIENYVMLVRTPAPASLPVVSVDVVSTSVLEDSGNNLEFIVSRTGDTSAPLTVFYNLGGTASFGADYTGANSSIVIPAGSTSVTASFTPVADSDIEPDETLSLEFASNAAYEIGVNSSATVTVLNDDLPVVTVDTASQTVLEENGVLSFSILLSSSVANDVVVPLNVSGTANLGQDYTLTQSSITILAGQTSAIVEINVVDDSELENSETVIVTLATPTNATLGTSIVHTVTINDNDSNSEWTNEGNPYDVNQDGHVSALDALIVINEINRRGERSLDPLTDSDVDDVDVSADGTVSALDALMVISQLNRDSLEGEGESFVVGKVSPLLVAVEDKKDDLMDQALGLLLDEGF